MNIIPRNSDVISCTKQRCDCWKTFFDWLILTLNLRYRVAYIILHWPYLGGPLGIGINLTFSAVILLLATVWLWTVVGLAACGVTRLSLSLAILRFLNSCLVSWLDHHIRLLSIPFAGKLDCYIVRYSQISIYWSQHSSYYLRNLFVKSTIAVVKSLGVSVSVCCSSCSVIVESGLLSVTVPKAMAVWYSVRLVQTIDWMVSVWFCVISSLT